MERGHIHFPEVMLTQKGKKKLLPSSCPMEVKNLVQLLLKKKKEKASTELRNPPLQVTATALSSKESG